MLQEIIANAVGAELGFYKHAVGAIHLYVKDTGPAKRFLREGFQKTTPIMQSMPKGDPWPHVRRVLDAETVIRTQGSTSGTIIENVDPYWADIIRLLQVFESKRPRDIERIKALRAHMSNPIYLIFVDRIIRALTASTPIDSATKKKEGF
jgi:thymidylate synthase